MGAPARHSTAAAHGKAHTAGDKGLKMVCVSHPQITEKTPSLSAVQPYRALVSVAAAGWPESRCIRPEITWSSPERSSPGCSRLCQSLAGLADTSPVRHRAAGTAPRLKSRLPRTSTDKCPPLEHRDSCRPGRSSRGPSQRCRGSGHQRFLPGRTERPQPRGRPAGSPLLAGRRARVRPAPSPPPGPGAAPAALPPPVAPAPPPALTCAGLPVALASCWVSSPSRLSGTASLQTLVWMVNMGMVAAAGDGEAGVGSGARKRRDRWRQNGARGRRRRF